MKAESKAVRLKQENTLLQVQAVLDTSAGHESCCTHDFPQRKLGKVAEHERGFMRGNKLDLRKRKAVVAQ